MKFAFDPITLTRSLAAIPILVAAQFPQVLFHLLFSESHISYISNYLRVPNSGLWWEQQH